MNGQSGMTYGPIVLADFDKSPISSRVIQGLRYAIGALPIVIAASACFYFNFMADSTKTSYEFWVAIGGGIEFGLLIAFLIYILLITAIYLIKVFRKVDKDDRTIVLSNGKSITEFQYKELLAKQKSYKVLFFPFRVTFRAVAMMWTIFLVLIGFVVFTSR